MNQLDEQVRALEQVSTDILNGKNRAANQTELSVRVCDIAREQGMGHLRKVFATMQSDSQADTHLPHFSLEIGLAPGSLVLNAETVNGFLNTYVGDIGQPGSGPAALIDLAEKDTPSSHETPTVQRSRIDKESSSLAHPQLDEIIS